MARVMVFLLLVFGYGQANADSFFNRNIDRITQFVGGGQSTSLRPEDDPNNVDDSNKSQAGLSDISGVVIEELPGGLSYSPISIGSGTSSSGKN